MLDVVIARKVNEVRRVSLPQTPAVRVGIGFVDGCSPWVALRPARNSEWALMLRPAPDPHTESRSRGLGRPRRLNSAWQLTLPEVWMTQVKLELGHWVYIQVNRARDGLKLVPAARVELQEPIESARKVPA